MNKVIPLIAFSVLLLVPVSQNAFATMWDYTNDFFRLIPQVGQGPDNAWFYYMGDPLDRDGIYPEMTIPTNISGENCYSNWGPNAFHVACSGFVHPGTFVGGELTPDVILGFRAPNADTYHVEGFFQDGDPTDFDGNPQTFAGVCTDITTTTTPGVVGSDVNVPAFPTACMDGSNLNEAMRTQLGGIDPLPTDAQFNFDIALDAGQFLYFRVNDFGLNRFDSTIVSIQINDGVVLPQPEEEQTIGGTLIPIETTTLLLANSQSFSWMIPVILSGIGIGLFVFRKSENS